MKCIINEYYEARVKYEIDGTTLVHVVGFYEYPTDKQINDRIISELGVSPQKIIERLIYKQELFMSYEDFFRNAKLMQNTLIERR